MTPYDLSAIGLEVSEAQAALVADFEAGLYTWNESKNLTRVWRDDFWVRHVLDSLLFQDLIPHAATLLEGPCLGSVTELYSLAAGPRLEALRKIMPMFTLYLLTWYCTHLYSQISLHL